MAKKQKPQEQQQPAQETQGDWAILEAKIQRLALLLNADEKVKEINKLEIKTQILVRTIEEFIRCCETGISTQSQEVFSSLWKDAARALINKTQNELKSL